MNKLLYFFNRRQRWELLALFFSILLGTFLELAGVTIFMPFVEVIMNPEIIKTKALYQYIRKLFNVDTNEGVLIVLAILIILIYVAKNAYLILWQNYMLKFISRCQENMASNLLSSYMRAPYTYFLKKNYAEMQRNINSSVVMVFSSVEQLLLLIAEIFVCIVLGAYLFKTSHSITIIVFGALVTCVGSFIYISKKISWKLGQKNQRYSAKLYQWINQGLGGIKEIKILQKENFFIQSYKNNYRGFADTNRFNTLLGNMPRYIVETVCMSSLLIAIIIKIYWGSGNIRTFIPQLTAFAVAAFRILPSAGKINAYINFLVYGFASIDNLYQDCKDLENENAECDQSDPNQLLNELIFENCIQIQQVTYHYPDSAKNVIDNVTFTIPKGKSIAFIGPSGEGKTTMADIILGILPPSKGRLLVDGVDLYMNIKLWYKHLGYIPQTIYLSDDTIKNNVAFGLFPDEIDTDQVWDALKQACLDEFIQSLPEGLETMVGDRGIRLSGGQRQRIGIARALYHNPEVLILDEATSALDNDTEQAVMESIEHLHGKKTMIIIAHRLTTIKNADLIYEITGGKVIKKGDKCYA